MTLKEIHSLRKIRNGDIRSFEELFHQYYPGMCSFAARVVRQDSVAEEVVQDVFLNIWKNRESLRIKSSWQNYLYRSVYNNALMYLRKQKREMPLDREWAESQSEHGENPGTDLEARELQDTLWQTLQQLPEQTQRIFRMSRFDGKKYREIALELSISVKTVEAHMGKALKALRISLDKHSQIEQS